MQFQIGDRVVHPVHGVGTVKTLTQENFIGDQVRLYYEVATDDMTVFVPVNDQGASVLRAIASKETLDQCRRLLKSRPLPLEKKYQLRQAEIAARLKSGSLRARCEMVRDLTAFRAQKALNEAEEALLRKLTKALADEWSAAEGISTRAALDEIDTWLAGAREAHPRERGA